MWFRNLSAYRLPRPCNLTSAHVGAALEPMEFKPCESLEMYSVGWVEPFNDGQLAYPIPGGHFFAALCSEKKNVPAQVVDRMTRERCAELEQQQGFRPGRKQTKEIKEAVIDELLPRAFTTRAVTRVWFDPVGGWLAMDTASAARCDEVFRMLVRSFEGGQFACNTLRTKLSPRAAMTDWLASDEMPADFTADHEAELQGTGDGKPTLRYIRHVLDDTPRHVAAGKQCTRLAMTWADRISFVLTDGLALKRIAPLDVLKEGEPVG
ncbi:MAG TPA: recombination-associated protein RdgC [Acidimicrobiales bacterium]|nr:recombination-associated protein RdgC [Acidimicrobiales bacterium]